MSVRKHTIEPGECLNSLAAEFGCAVQDIRKLEGNEELMAKRPHSGCFNPGDQIYIPQPNGKFTINDGEELELVVGEGSFDLPVRLLDNNLEPLSDIVVKCIGSGMEEPLEAVTDTTGQVIFSLPLSADKGMISYRVAGKPRVEAFRVGHSKPYSEIEGKLQALNNALAGKSPSQDYQSFCNTVATAANKTVDEVEQNIFGGSL